MDKALWKLTLLDFLLRLETKHPALSTFPSLGKSDAGRSHLQVQMTTGFLHSPFKPTVVVKWLIKGAGVIKKEGGGG